MVGYPKGDFFGRLMGGSSLLVGAMIAAALPTAAAAQNTSPTGSGSSDSRKVASDAADEKADIIVTGTRRALRTSQQIKRNADTVVDSITASDIGAFPDKSAAEALQRVSGVTVNRFSASDDTSHFSADPSGVLVRGLSSVRSEYNGRDTFSANSSRGLSWEDIAPELMAGVDVYKNQTAAMIEGGIAGSINLRTRVPFDASGQVFQVNAIANYGDIRKKVTPDVSALYSNRWHTSAGEIGILLDFAHSQVKSESRGVAFGRTAVFKDVYQPGYQYIPSSVGLRDTQYDRTRDGFAGALQWKSNSGALVATAQYNRSKFHETWREHGVISYLTDLFAFPADFVFTNGGAHASAIPRPAPGTAAFTFDADGNFQSGTLVNQQTDYSWWGGGDGPNGTGQYSGQLALNDQGQPMLHACYSWGTAFGPPGTGPGGCGVDARGPDLNAVTRYNDLHRMTQDASFNLKWTASPQLDFNFDGQYVDAALRNYDVEVGQYSFANPTLTSNGNGPPTLTFGTPTNINQSAGGLSNPNNYRYNHAMDHREQSNGHELALRADGNYRFENSWLDSLHFGARYSDREQTVRYTAYNWGNIVNDWNLGANQYPYWNIDKTTPSGAFKGYPAGLYEVSNFTAPFGGGTNQYVFFNMNELENHGIDKLSYSNLGIGQDQWEPICSNGGTAKTGPRTGEVPGTCFRPDELNKLSEKTTAAYAMLKFGGHGAEVGGMGFSGNVGIRYIRTEDRSEGSTVYPLLSAGAFNCARNVAGPGQPAPGLPYTSGCYLFGNATLLASGPPPAGFTDIALAGSPSVLAFNNGSGAPGSVRATHNNWLPSLNLRFDISRTALFRFAASRGLTRPDIGYLKNYTTITTTLPSGNDPTDPRYVKNAQGQVTGINPTYTGSGYNPRLKPMTATMLDLTFEDYFATVGQFSVGVFYKKFQNYIQYGSNLVPFTNNGVTNTIEIRSPQNGKGGSLYGAEASFQRFFDFLPGALSGLGIQVNGTYVHNKGILNSGLKTQSGTNGGSQAQPGTGGTILPVSDLEGLSKYAFNVVGMYEKYGFAARVAYNWRSKFLVTAVDCCTYLPAYEKAAGYLDASISYAINPHIEVSIKGSNLLNTQAKLLQQVSDGKGGAVLVPNSWFENDRRFQFGVRAKF